MWTILKRNERGWYKLKCDACGFWVWSPDPPERTYHRCGQPKERLPDPPPCIHKGEQTRVIECQLCGERDRMEPVYVCSIYGECTVRKFKSGTVGALPTCLGCTHYEPSFEATE